MCTRFGLTAPQKVKDRYNLLSFLLNLPPRFNVAPGQETGVIVKKTDSQYNQAEKMRWGMLPSWTKDPRLANMMINARVETLDKKPSYDKPLKFQRCIIPVNFYFEWQEQVESSVQSKRWGFGSKPKENQRVPYLIRLKYDEMFSLAGVYDINERVDQKPIKSFTIITAPANDFISSIYHRMPAILKRSDENIWLDPNITDQETLIRILKPYPSELMEAYTVSSLVDDPNNDMEDITQRLF